MGDFKQSILPHWDYMWKDRAGNRFMGMVMYPEKESVPQNASENKKSI